MRIAQFLIAGCIALTCSLAGCSTNDQLMYNEESGIYIYNNTFSNLSDSILYSFATQPASVVKDTVYVPLRLTGTAVNRDRQIGLEVVAANTTARADLHYKLGEAVLPANEYSARVPVYIFRTPDLENSMVWLQLKVTNSPDLKAAVDSRLLFRIRITAQMTRPVSWSDEYFGVFSMTKLRFMVTVFPGESFESDAYSLSKLSFMSQKLRAALSDYIQANGPLIDENGNDVFFPG